MSDETNDPWSWFDYVIGAARDFFAAVGLVSTVAFVVGYFWSR